MRVQVRPALPNREGIARGRFRLRKRPEGGPGLNVTDEWIARHKRLILTFDSVLAAIDSVAKPKYG